MCYDLAIGSDCAHLITESEQISKNNEESDAGRTTVLSFLWVRSCGMDYDHHYQSHHHEGARGSPEGGGCEPIWVLSEVSLGSTFCEPEESSPDDISGALVVHHGDKFNYNDGNNSHNNSHYSGDHDKSLQGSSKCDDCSATLTVRRLMKETETWEYCDLGQGDLSEPDHADDASEGSSSSTNSSSSSSSYCSSEQYDASVSNSSSSNNSYCSSEQYDAGVSSSWSSDCDDHHATWTVPSLMTGAGAWEYGDLGLEGLSESERDDDDCGVSSSTSDSSRSWRYDFDMGSSSNHNGSSCCSENGEEQPLVHPVWQTEEFGLDANLWKGDDFGPGASLSDHGNPGGLGEDSSSTSSSTCFKSDGSGSGSFWEAECDGLGAEACFGCFCSEQFQQEKEEGDDGSCSSLWTVGGGFGWHTREKSRLSTWTAGN